MDLQRIKWIAAVPIRPLHKMFLHWFIYALFITVYFAAYRRIWSTIRTIPTRSTARTKDPIRNFLILAEPEKPKMWSDAKKNFSGFIYFFGEKYYLHGEKRMIWNENKLDGPKDGICAIILGLCPA